PDGAHFTCYADGWSMTGVINGTPGYYQMQSECTPPYGSQFQCTGSQANTPATPPQQPTTPPDAPPMPTTPTTPPTPTTPTTPPPPPANGGAANPVPIR